MTKGKSSNLSKEDNGYNVYTRDGYLFLWSSEGLIFPQGLVLGRYSVRDDDCWLIRSNHEIRLA